MYIRKFPSRKPLKSSILGYCNSNAHLIKYPLKSYLFRFYIKFDLTKFSAYSKVTLKTYIRKFINF